MPHCWNAEASEDGGRIEDRGRDGFNYKVRVLPTNRLTTPPSLVATRRDIESTSYPRPDKWKEITVVELNVKCVVAGNKSHWSSKPTSRSWAQWHLAHPNMHICLIYFQIANIPIAKGDQWGYKHQQCSSLPSPKKWQSKYDTICSEGDDPHSL